MSTRIITGLTLTLTVALVTACSGSPESTEDVSNDHTSSGASTSAGAAGGTDGSGAAGGNTSDPAAGATGGSTVDPGSGGSTGGSASAGSGGTETSGGTGNTVCDLEAPPLGPACSAVFTASNPMIDSMEGDGPHGDADNGMPGHWWAAGDGTGTSTGQWSQSGGMKYFNVVLDPARDESLRAMAFNGQGFVDWGVAMGIGVASCVDASAFQGVKFWVKASGSDVTGTFNLGTFETEPEPNGACTGGCGGTYATAFEATTEWTEVSVPFCDLTPTGAAVGLPIAISKIVQIRWLIPGEEDFDILIDDVAFY
jgi:hypothetical protein